MEYTANINIIEIKLQTLFVWVKNVITMIFF